MSSRDLNSPAPSSRSGGRVVATYTYESGPPANLNNQDRLSTTKTEEWTTKKKKDVLVTKQIETRVKREILVTDDGQILEDSGPQVTTDTTEETKTEEQETTEHKASGGESPGPGWKLVPGATVVNETKKTNSTNHESREEKRDVEETEEIGGFKRDDIFRALKHKERAAIKRGDSSSTDSRARDQGSRSSGGGGGSGNRNVIQHTSRTVVDTQETNEVSDFKDGEVTTETRKTSQRQEYLGDDGPHGLDGVHGNPIMTETTSMSTLTKTPRAVTGGEAPVTWERAPAEANESWDSVSERMLHQKREHALRRPEPSSDRFNSIYKRSVDIDEEEETRKSETNRWIEDHFGSQDLEDSGLTRSASTSTLSHIQDSEGRVRADVADTLKKTHYLRRQQIPQGKFRKGPAPQPPHPPPPPPIPITIQNHSSTLKSNGHSSHSSTLPKKQYYLGEDPGIGERFTGMTSSHNIRPIYKSESLRDISTWRNGYTPPQTPLSPPVLSSTPKFATLGRDERRKEEIRVKQAAVRTGSLPSEANGSPKGFYVNGGQQNGGSRVKTFQKSESENLTSVYTTLPRTSRTQETVQNGRSQHLPKASILKTSHRKSPVPPAGPPPSVSAIINSFRTKEFLERENSIITMRDDESVVDNRYTSYNPRPAVFKSVPSPVEPIRNGNTSNRNTPSRKQHVIKISIRSDDSDYGTPVNSPKINGNGNFPLTSQQNSERDRSYNDSIVKNAINSLLRNKPNVNSNGYPDNSYSSLSRSNKSSGSNLGGSRTWLTVSTPNVNKLEGTGRKVRNGRQEQSNYTVNMNRSQSIGSLNRPGHPASYEEDNSYGSSSGESPLPSNGYTGKVRIEGRSYTKHGLNHQTKKRHQFMQRLLEHENNGGREYYRGTPLAVYSSSPSPPPSPVNEHRMKLPSSIPPPLSSSRSPPPPLTRPYSPSGYYDDYNSNKVSSRIVLGRTEDYSLPSSSPSPPATLHRQRPPSPIPPRDYSVASDDHNGHVSVNKIASGSSRGSDASSSNQPERVQVVSKKKVTTTTVKRKEVDHPDRYQPPVRINARK